MRPLVVRLRLPPPSLAPHNRGHWRLRASDVAVCRRNAFVAALAAMQEEGASARPVFDAASLDVEYDVSPRKFVRGYRPRDVANALGACKAYIDGCVDCGVVPDDSSEFLSIGKVEIVRKASPGVTLTFRGLERP